MSVHTTSIPIACAMPGCTNHSGEGRFVGNVCAPCHAGKPMLALPSRRELFAAMALQGITACPETRGTYREICREAVDYADALLAALYPQSDEKNHE